MIRIAISCGEGFSSGFLAKRLQQMIVEQHLEDRASIVRIPVTDLIERQDEVDVGMVMPHVEWKVNKYVDQFRIPLYIIPFKTILKPTLEDYIEDAEDILEAHRGEGGKFCFPGEEKTVRVTRECSYRKWIAEHPVENKE